MHILGDGNTFAEYVATQQTLNSHGVRILRRQRLSGFPITGGNMDGCNNNSRYMLNNEENKIFLSLIYEKIFEKTMTNFNINLPSCPLPEQQLLFLVCKFNFFRSDHSTKTHLNCSSIFFF